MATSLHTLELGDDIRAWQRLGFAPTLDNVLSLGGVALRCHGGGGGIRSWRLAGARGPAEVDGVPTAWISDPAVLDAEHPNGATGVDHVVLFTDSRERTAAALADAGAEVKRFAEPPAVPLPVAFVRLANVVLEVAQGGGPTRLWGVVIVVPDVDALADQLGDALGRPKDAVQPGRRIVTARRADGRETALAFMTPRVSRSRA